MTDSKYKNLKIDLLYAGGFYPHDEKLLSLSFRGIIDMVLKTHLRYSSIFADRYLPIFASLIDELMEGDEAPKAQYEECLKYALALKLAQEAEND